MEHTFLQLYHFEYESYLMLYMLVTELCRKKLKFETIFSYFKGYLKNHCTNTRLVCTHLNAFCMLNSNMALKIRITNFFEKNEKFRPIVCTRHPCGEG